MVRPEGILALCTLAVAPRSGDDREVVAAAAARWGVRPSQRPRCAADRRLVEPGAERASAAGLPIRYLVPEAVEESHRPTRHVPIGVIDRPQAERLIADRLSETRREHSRRVAAEAAELARRFGAAPEAAELAGLLHDYCRDLSDAETLAAAARFGLDVGPVETRRPRKILHGPVAAAELAEAGLDADIAAAIARHTTGGPGMTVLEKCLYLADFCEPGRAFPGLDEVRALARGSLDAAVAAAARISLLDLITGGAGWYPTPWRCTTRLMPATKGYRVDRLRRRRRTKAELWQAGVLYALAGVVAFGAVFGAWHIGSSWLKQPEEQPKSGYLALVTMTAPGSGAPVAAALVVKDAADGVADLCT